MVNVEVCANSVQSAIAAEKGGAVRVELCSNLFEGGTTPAKSQIELTRENVNIDLNVIIRPRGGDFLYDDLDFATMKRDIQLCGELNCNGVVIGILTADGKVDIQRNIELVELARKFDLSVTFHRAFDRSKDLFSALEDIVNIGCDRILTSGGYASAFDGRFVLKQLVEQAADRIVIMAGAGVTEKNVKELVKTTGVKEVHGTFQNWADGSMIYKSPHFSDAAEYSNLLSDANRVRTILLNANLLSDV